MSKNDLDSLVSKALSLLLENPLHQIWFADLVRDANPGLREDAVKDQALQLIRYMLEEDLLVIEFVEPTERHPRDFVRYDNWTPDQQVALLNERWKALGTQFDFIVDIEPTVKGNRRAVAEQAARGWFPRWYDEPYIGHGRWVRANGSEVMDPSQG